MDPLTGSDTWVDYKGTSVVRKVWDGRANLGELNVSGPAGRIEGLSLRLYDPKTGQWRIHWANSRDGNLGAAMNGGFRDGTGEFYNQELFNGRGDSCPARLRTPGRQGRCVAITGRAGVSVTSAIEPVAPSASPPGVTP